MPLRVTTLNTPPAARPYSAENVFVSTLNSCTMSGFAFTTGWFCDAAVFGAPSRRNSFEFARCPLMEYETVEIWSMTRLFTPAEFRTPGTNMANA